MKLIILDRDGVINEDSDDFIKTPEEWIPLVGSAEAIAQLHKAGFVVVVATNQSGIGRGYFSVDTLTAIHQKMIKHVEAAGGKISAIFYCPHGPDDGCDCRKPKAGLIDQIIAQFQTNVVNTPLVGDSLRDLQCGMARGCLPVLVKTGKGTRTLEKGLPSELGDLAVYDSLLDFTQHFLAQERA